MTRTQTIGWYLHPIDHPCPIAHNRSHVLRKALVLINNVQQRFNARVRPLGKSQAELVYTVEYAGSWRREGVVTVRGQGILPEKQRNNKTGKYSRKQRETTMIRQKKNVLFCLWQQRVHMTLLVMTVFDMLVSYVRFGKIQQLLYMGETTVIVTWNDLKPIAIQI